MDLGNDPAFADQLQRLRECHFEWSRRHHTRTTKAAEQIEKMTDNQEPPGILIGYRDKEELHSNGLDLPDQTDR